MKKLIRTSILPGIVLLTLTQLLAQPSFASPWPKLETDRDKLIYGLAVRAQTRPFFSGTFNYGMEWWNIAADQEKVKASIQGLYPAELDSRPLVEITSFTTGEKDVPGLEQFEAFKTSLIKELAQHAAHITTKQNLLYELSTRITALQATRPGDLLAQLIRSVKTPAEQNPILQGTLAEKLGYIEANLPDDLSQTALAKNSKNRYSAATLGSKQDAVKLVERLLTYEKEVVPLLALTVICEKLPANASRAEIAAAIGRFDQEMLAELQNSATTTAALKSELRLATPPDMPQTSVDKASEWGANLLNKTVQKLAEAGSEKVTIHTPHLQLIQKPRDLAILRSSVARDCGHTCSFSKADDPNVYVFYLVDVQSKEELGYIESEIKASSEGDVLYVNSINGPAISAEQSEELMSMLYARRAELGVKEVTLLSHNLGSQMNYDATIHYVERKIDGRARISIRPKNPAVAAVIDPYLRNDYQKEFQNTEAVIFTPDAGPGKLQTSFAKRPDTFVLNPVINPTDLLLFALEMDSTERWLPEPGKLFDGERAIVAGGLSLEDYKALRSIMQNHEHRPYDQYIELAKKSLAQHHIKVDAQFMKERPHLFYDGLLASIDALKGSRQKSTLRLIGQILKRGMWHATWGLKEVARDQQNLEIINGSKELEDVFRWASYDIGFHTIQFRNMASAGIGFPQLRSPDMTRELFRLVAHGNSWAPSLSTEILGMIYPDLSSTVLSQYMNDPDEAVRDGVTKLRLSLKQTRAEKKAANATKRAQMCEGIFGG